MRRISKRNILKNFGRAHVDSAGTSARIDPAPKASIGRTRYASAPRHPHRKIFGISIDLDYSWFLIVGLLAWMLAVSYYPAEFRYWSTGEYWLMGLITAVMLFVSVLIHELAHSLVAQHYGIPVPRITLFLFGGVSQIAEEPPARSRSSGLRLSAPL